MRIATYNVEWFDHLFDDGGQLRDDAGWSGRQDVTRARQIAALGAVFRAINADAVMVIEAPDHNGRRSTKTALETFARRYRLRAREALIGFPTQTQQEIALLFDPDVMTARHDPRGAAHPVQGDPEVARFDQTWRHDTNGDGRAEPVTWSKPPLEVAVTTATGADLRLIGVHAKSKAPHGARSETEQVRLSIQNRHKQIAQCLWLRRRVNHHLAAGQSLIVLGDFNDGPGLDAYEKLFGRSGVETVMGENGDTRLHDPHVRRALTRRFAAPPTTARFRMPDGTWLQALLDYIMISPDLRAHQPHWRIWHPFDNGACFADEALRDALLTASDHFPVTLDIDL
jgi:hypothetical protein